MTIGAISRSGLFLAVALVPWLGCNSADSGPTDVGGSAAGTTGTVETHVGGAGGAGGTQSGGNSGKSSGGSAGNPGSGGSIGNRGPVGTATAGSTGSPATAGTAGNSGTAGATNTTGTTGAAGTTAVQPPVTPPTTGTAGAAGMQPPVTPPTTGTAGASGTPATSGTAGATGAAATGSGGTSGSGGPAVTGSAGAGTAGATPTAGTAGATGTMGGPAGSTGQTGNAGNAIKNVFVIAMENEPAAAIYGNKNAPYLNGLLAKYARATAFTDPLADGIPSEPHYVWMEAGTNKFSDVTFTGDGDPSSGNSTKNTAHLTTQMMAASPPISWMGVMQGLNSSTGACPISSSGMYGAKHDPFVFFQDIAGGPPSKSSALCAAHHAAFTSGQALVQGTVPQYTFISPDVCNDMHGDSACPSGDPIAQGDAWLAANVPALIDYVNAHSGVIFIVWDEPEGGSTLIPFFAIGPHVKPGYTSTMAFTHSSLVKTIEEIFALPILPTVAGANDFADLFQAGTFR